MGPAVESRTNKGCMSEAYLPLVDASLYVRQQQQHSISSGYGHTKLQSPWISILQSSTYFIRKGPALH